MKQINAALWASLLRSAAASQAFAVGGILQQLLHTQDFTCQLQRQPSICMQPSSACRLLHSGTQQLQGSHPSTLWQQQPSTGLASFSRQRQHNPQQQQQLILLQQPSSLLQRRWYSSSSEVAKQRLIAAQQRRQREQEALQRRREAQSTAVVDTSSNTELQDNTSTAVVPQEAPLAEVEVSRYCACCRPTVLHIHVDGARLAGRRRVQLLVLRQGRLAQRHGVLRVSRRAVRLPHAPHMASRGKLWLEAQIHHSEAHAAGCLQKQRCEHRLNLGANMG